MSRVGVKTLLTWYRTKTPFSVRQYVYTYIRWDYSKELYVTLDENCYLIYYVTNNRSHKIEVSQDRQRIVFVYCNNSKRIRLDYEGGNLVDYQKPPRIRAQFYLSLCKMPQTDMFTMFPIIVNILKQATNDWTANIL